ncbi:hypothetical protein CRENBAI_022775 [Crenichthys baileyi]|uniref:ALMS motif domain-containing protein n=1 Tax=Crenichthys baileyi TaxID=28760 RepID=A0AAV9S478_9TELE
MEPQERAAAPSFWQKDKDMKGPDGQTATPEARSQSSVVQDQRRPKMETDGRELQQSQREALQLEFQDSNLSPVLSLLPLTSGLEHSITNYSFFHQGDPEFAPLRAFPDVSVVSERLHFPIHDSTKLNIDERIPLYLQNLGIDQTPSKILTPFAPRGPIREPEFSPTDLCTIKGSSGTPSKSTQPSEGSSPHKGDFSRSSVLSVDSSISIPFSLDSLGPAASMSEQVRARTSPSNSEAAQREDRPVSCSQPDERSTILHPGQQQHDGRQDFIQTEDRFQPNWVAMKITGTERNVVLQSSHSLGQDAENSSVSTRALSEISLSQAKNMISTGSSTASSGPNAASHFSDKDIFRPPTTKDSRLQSSSFSSFSSTGGDLKSHSSLPLARSSSESMLTSEKPKQSSAGQESLTSSWQPDNLSTQTVSIGPQDGAVSNSAGASLVMSKSARRAEPEGCSAAPPDKIPTQPSTAAVTQQLNATSTDGKGLPEEEEKATPRDPGAESRSSSPIPEAADQGVISGGSSESSLAGRVAKLLQNESPATMASSTPSVTDQEEGKATEWLKSKASGQQCEPLRLNLEDRRRIEEIKQELLLNNPTKSQGSTDTESSAASSVCVNKKNNPPKEAEAFSDLIDANKKLGLSMDHPDPQTQLQSILHLNLEARVCEIAAREGVKLPTKRPQTLPSIIIPTHSHSVTSSPSMSPAPPLSPASDPLHLTELSTGTVRPTSSNKSLPTNQEEVERVPSAQTTREPPSVYDETTSNHIATSQTAPGNQKRQDTVGGQSEEPPLDKQDVVVRHFSTNFLNHHEEIYAQTSSFSAVGHEAKQAFRTTHLPHVHFTLPPKTSDHTSSFAVHRPGATLRDPSSAVSSPDEGVGSSSPAEWYDSRKPAPERSDASTVFKAPRGKGITAPSQSFAQRHGSAASLRPFTAETPVPVLLPYKPRGSEELFYIPHTEADASSTNQSDTTMESSHTGSDDAVPPSFSSEVLGDQDPGLGRGVAIRHKEGIYSKRLKTASFRMQDPEHTDASAAERGSPALSQSPKSSSQVSDTFTRVPSINNHKASKRDQETTGTDGSVVPDSASTSSTCTAPPERGPSRALTAKRAVRVVNKSIQAGELEIVHNGTRRHTRDVGTTFPSPGEAKGLEQISPSLSSTAGGRGGGWRVLPKSNNSQKQKKSKRSPPKPYPKGVSWFISADNLRSETRKENRPEESAWRPNTAWFEPYSRVHPWREPLRQRQVHEDGSNRHFKTLPELDPNPKSKILSSGLAWVSLKEALEMCRPDFISRSRQRVRCLALQAEERRLQAVFRRERNLPFNQLGEPERLAKPAGTALLRRAVPRKEMIQRSKQIYENLPEVRRRREEEKRKAEYQSYRLNAQLYNKRITNLVLGRRAAWH